MADATRASLSDLRQRTFGRHDKPLSELSDEELEEELLRRRRERADRRSPAPKGGPERRAEPDTPRTKQISQYYANLELKPGASIEDVRRAYRELMKRYHPDKHATDPELHRSATELAQSLTQAYTALIEHLSKPRKR